MSSRFRDNPHNHNGPSENNNGDNQRGGHDKNGNGQSHRHSRRNANPIGNWINRRRRHRQTTTNASAASRAVGTEAQAIQNIANNAKHFKYPTEGFITPVEHSLLYAMILHPEHYPESVVRREIEEEDFEQYLFVRESDNDAKKMYINTNNETATTTAAAASTTTFQDRNDADEDGNHDNTIQQQDYRASYAQLSALLALSAEKNSSTPSNEPQSQTQAEPEPTRNSLTIQATSNITCLPPLHTDNTQQQYTIAQTLCRKIIKTITKYSTLHNLDRQTEISDLLSPVERRCQIRNEQTALKQLLPAYAGYTLSLMTGNPLPLLIGAASLALSGDVMNEENSNVNEIKGLGGRMGDVETAGLLDECEDD